MDPRTKRVLLCLLYFLATLQASSLFEKNETKLQKRYVKRDQFGAMLGMSSCMISLGYRYLRGNGIPVDKRKGFWWLHKAFGATNSENDRALAALAIADCYRRGDGTARCLSLAMIYARIVKDEAECAGSSVYVELAEKEIQEIRAEADGLEKTEKR